MAYIPIGTKREFIYQKQVDGSLSEWMGRHIKDGWHFEEEPSLSPQGGLCYTAIRVAKESS